MIIALVFADRVNGDDAMKDVLNGDGMAKCAFYTLFKNKYYFIYQLIIN